MNTINEKRIFGQVAWNVARSLAKTIACGDSIYFYFNGKLIRFAGQNLGWSQGNVGDYGFCNDAARLAMGNKGYLYIG